MGSTIASEIVKTNIKIINKKYIFPAKVMYIEKENLLNALSMKFKLHRTILKLWIEWSCTLRQLSFHLRDVYTDRYLKNV